MARDFAAVNVAIWQDPDFRALPSDAKLLYLTLWTHPQLSRAGVVDWRPGRLAALIDPTWMAEDVRAVADCLEARLFIVTDEQTEECLIRSWVRFDGLMKSPIMSVTFANDYAAATSDAIRGVIVHELHRLRERDPKLAAWTKNRVLEVLEMPSIDPRERDLPTDPLTGVVTRPLTHGLTHSATHGGTVAAGVGGYPSANPSPTPSPAPTPSPLLRNQPLPSVPHQRPDDSSRELETVSPQTVFPRSWTPGNRHHAYALENQLDLAHEAQMFAEHARANGRTAVDWDSAFMTWLGKAKPRGRPGISTGTNRAMNALDIAAQYEAQEGNDDAEVPNRQIAR